MHQLEQMRRAIFLSCSSNESKDFVIFRWFEQAKFASFVRFLPRVVAFLMYEDFRVFLSASRMMKAGRSTFVVFEVRPSVRVKGIIVACLCSGITNSVFHDVMKLPHSLQAVQQDRFVVEDFVQTNHKSPCQCFEDSIVLQPLKDRRDVWMDVLPPVFPFRLPYDTNAQMFERDFLYIILVGM